MGVTDMGRAVAFWSEALGYVPRGELGDTWTVLEPRVGTGAVLSLERSETPVQEHPRMHLDLGSEGVVEQTTEVERLVGLGARHVDWDLYPEDPDFVVLADPEGNRFCVVDTTRS